MTAAPGPPVNLFPLVRHLSWRVTAVVARSSLTPNQISLVSLAVGLAALALFATGAQALGALVFVVSYVLDHTDGEVARLKGLTSRFGAQLDTFVDWVVNAGFFLALGLGMTRDSGEALWLWLGAAGAAGSTVNYLLAVRRRPPEGVATSGPGEPVPWTDLRLRERLRIAFRELFRADFCFLVLALALVGQLWLLLPAGAVGAQAYWVAGLLKPERDVRV